MLRAFEGLWYVLSSLTTPTSCVQPQDVLTAETQTVDWNNGKAVAGADESKILAMLDQLPKK